MPFRRGPALILLLLALLAGAATVTTSSGAQDLDELRQRAESTRGSERSLAADVARLGRLLTRLRADIAVVERRRAAVRQELAEDRARLEEVRSRLRAQRARAERLRARLHESQTVLSRRLVELYKAADPDLLGVVLGARDFADLLDRASFLQRIASQDRRIILNVKRARGEAKAAVTQLAGAERRQEEATAAVAARSKALAGIGAALADRQAAYAQAQAARATALSDARSSRRSLESQIARLEARRARLTGASSGGPWAIPWPIVQCESGGQNLPPNSAGASGYYQIIPATWRGFGGSGPAAYLASKAEQDRVAARIWNGGRGASNWVCASLVAG
jgi:peptidoglycan hydrolase CwlO-like protein